jgi:hypothetical protein
MSNLTHVTDFERLQANNPEYLLLYKKEFDLTGLGEKANRRETYICTIKVTGLTDEQILDALLNDFRNRGRILKEATTTGV